LAKLGRTRSKDELPAAAPLSASAPTQNHGFHFRRRRAKLDAVTFTPTADGRYLADSQTQPWPKTAGRFTSAGFTVEELVNRDGSKLVPGRADAPGLWSVYGDDGKILGWSADVEGRERRRQLALWIGERRGRAAVDQAQAVADMLALALRAQGARGQIFFLPDGRVVVDVVKPAASSGRRPVEGDKFAVYARDAALPTTPTRCASPARRDAGGFDSPGLIPIVALMLRRSRPAPSRANLAGATSRDLQVSGLICSWRASRGAAVLGRRAFRIRADVVGLCRGVVGDRGRAAGSRLTPDQQAEYRRTLSDVQGAQTEAAIKDKLAERYDIRNPRPRTWPR